MTMLLKAAVVSEQLGRRGVSRIVRRAAAGAGERASAKGDRGDVNGYVFVTLMTAGVVMVIWVVARDRLSEVFNRAISSVTGP